MHHASFVIISGKIIYIDPYRIKPQDTLKSDFVLITHDHFDHFSPDDINRVSGDKTIVIVPESIRNVSGILGRVQTISTHESLLFDNMRISTIPAYNNDKPFHKKGFGVGYVIDIIEHGKEYCIYHAGDTDFTSEMRMLSGVDYALIPVGGTYTMDSRDASGFIRAVRPKNMIPMHYGDTVGISLQDDLMPLREACKETGTRLIVLKPQEHIDFYSK